MNSARAGADDYNFIHDTLSERYGTGSGSDLIHNMLSERYSTGSGSDLAPLGNTRSLPLPVPYHTDEMRRHNQNNRQT